MATPIPVCPFAYRLSLHQTLRYGTKTLDLETTPEKVRHELYRADGSSRMEFQGLVSARLAIKATNDAAAGVDAALAQLKSSLATIQQEKDANKYGAASAAARVLCLVC